MAKKGKLIMDANSYTPLIKGIHAQNWEVERVKPSDRSLSDTAMLKQYAKGRYPVITGDTKLHTQNPAQGGATSIIVHPETKTEDMGALQTKVNEFFKEHTGQSVRKKLVWEIELDVEKEDSE